MNPDCSLLYWSEPLKGWVCEKEQTGVLMWIIVALVTSAIILLFQGWIGMRGRDREIRLLEKLVCVAEEIRGTAEQILKALQPAGKMQLRWGVPSEGIKSNVRGEETMPGQETDTQTIPCTEIETDGDGNPVTLNPANVQWAIDDSTIATLTQNADGSATFKAVPPVPPAVDPRTANVTCTDTVTGVIGTDTLTVTKNPTTGKMVLTFGTPA